MMAGKPLMKSSTKNVTCVKVKPGYSNSNKEIEIRYIDTKVIGSGSFGMVYMAKLYDTNENVAIKKVYQDKRFKNRELQIMRRLEHPNIIRLMYYYYAVDNTNEEYLYLVLEFFPKTVHQLIKAYAQTGHVLDLFNIKLYMFQLFRGLSFMSSLNICHRDIKPHNLLVNPEKGTLRICDFGSAKVMNNDDTNVSYICSRYYRAPELIFGAVYYTTKIDVWSAGTVMAELFLGKPLFPGDSAVHQLVEIIKVSIIGTPSKEEIYAMNQNYKDFKLPTVKSVPLEKLFKGRSLHSAVNLLNSLFRYNPSARSSAIEALAHPFFDELRNPELEEMPNGRLMPRLFDWLEREVNIRPDLNKKIFPRSKYVPNCEEIIGLKEDT
ncbi:kinase domain protein [Dictyocaulus viviparus]|uniref:Kinase domain protein n=1 Tax=Dictyocaulus viviparus TaxID=29172 RepID=A0A0D8XXM8_DICVI|nr:kinase domain protein [Dictyocaulus viviparus]